MKSADDMDVTYLRNTLEAKNMELEELKVDIELVCKLQSVSSYNNISDWDKTLEALRIGKLLIADILLACFTLNTR